MTEQRETLARWKSRSGKWYVELYRTKHGVSYNARDACGHLGEMSDEDAITEMSVRVERGGFQPDNARTPMKKEMP